MQHQLTGLAVLTVAAALAGCDNSPRMDYSSVGLVNAEGTVTLDGQPLPHAVITFDSPDGTFSYAMTDDSGHYELQFDSAMQGVTAGAKIVRISTTRQILGLNTDEAEAGEISTEQAAAPTGGAEKVPAKYNEDSELTVEVAPARTEYDFELRS